MFVFHFLISNVVIAFVIIILLFIRKKLMYKTSAVINKKIWLSLIALMIFSLIPNINIDFNRAAHTLEYIDKAAAYGKAAATVKDFYSVEYRFNTNILLLIWIMGMAVGFIFTVTVYIIIMLKINMYKNADAEIKRIFHECEKNTATKANLLMSTPKETPFSFGIFKKYVVIPDLPIQNENELRYIICHELIHHKHHDNVFSLILNILKCIYWFNPLVHAAFCSVRTDMEMYCDSDVLKYSECGTGFDYGSTILNFIQRNSESLRTSLSDTGREIRERIQKLTKFKRSRKAEIALIIQAIAVTVVSFGAISICGYNTDNRYRGKFQSEEIDLSYEFDDAKGCFVFYDGESYKIYNKDMAVKRFSPNSTYKPIIALNALESGIITPKSNYMNWNGKQYPFKEWMKNQTLDTAMENSVNWYFQNLDDGLDYGRFVKTINYGNKFTGLDKKSYWLENCLKISAVEQVDILRNIYYNNFGFDSESIKAVKASMKLGEDFYGKTGSGNINGEAVSGWFIGFRENGKNTDFFALYLKGNATGSDAYKKTLNILDRIDNEL